MQNRFIISFAKALYAASQGATEGGVKDIARRAAAMLAKRHLVKHAPEVFRELERVRRDAHGIVFSRIVSARPLSVSARTAISSYIAARTKKEVELEWVIDERVIGGFSLTFEDTRIDATLAHNIKELQRLVTI